jgi:hypothetical protein
MSGKLRGQLAEPGLGVSLIAVNERLALWLNARFSAQPNCKHLDQSFHSYMWLTNLMH